MSIDNSISQKKPQETYGDLLHMANSNNGVTSLARNIYDGAGNALPIRISTNRVFLDADTFVSASILNECQFLPSVGNTATIVDPSFTGAEVSWGKADRCTFGNQFRKVTAIKATKKTMLLDNPDILSDFVVMDVSVDITSFDINSHVGDLFTSYDTFSREIHILIIPNGYNINFASSSGSIVWAEGQYPTTGFFDHFGEDRRSPCLVRLVYFNSIGVSGYSDISAWIGMIVGPRME